MTILENAAYLLDGNPSMINNRLLKESVWDNSYDRDAPKWILDHWDVVFPETDKPEDPNEAKRMAKEKVAKINALFNHPVDYTLGCPNDRELDANGNEIGPRVYEMKIIRMFCLGLVRILYGELHYETEFVNPRKIEDLKKCILTALVADRKAQMASRGGQVTYPWSTDLNGKSFNQLKAELLPHYQEAKETLAEWDRSWHERNPNSHRVTADDAPAEEIEAADDGTIDDGLPQPDMSDAVRLGDYNVKWIQNHKQSSCWNKYTNKVSTHAGCNWCITIPDDNCHWRHYMERYDYPTVYFLWKDNFKELKRQDYNVEPFYSQQPYNDWGKSLMCLMVKADGHGWKFLQLTSRYNHFKGDGAGGFNSDGGGWGDSFARNAEDAARIIGCTVEELKQACPVHERPENYQDTGEDYSQDQSVFGQGGGDSFISEESARNREAFNQSLVNTPYSILRLINDFNADCIHLSSGDNITIVCPGGTGSSRRIFVNGFPMNNEWYRSVELIGSRAANDLNDVLFQVRYRDKKYNIIDVNNFKYLPRNVDNISISSDVDKVEVTSNHKINVFDLKKRKFMYARSLDARTVTPRTSDGYYTDGNDTDDGHYKIHAPNGEMCFDKEIVDYRWPTSRSVFVYEKGSVSYAHDLKTNETIFSHTGDCSYMNIASYTGTPIMILQIAPNRMRDNCGAVVYNQITHKVVAKFETAYNLINSASVPYERVRDRGAVIIHRESNDEHGIYKLSFISLLTGKIIKTVEVSSAHAIPTVSAHGTIMVSTQPTARETVIYYFDLKGNELHRHGSGGGSCIRDIGYNANEMFFKDNHNNLQFIRNGEVLYAMEHADDLRVKSVQLDHKWYYFIKDNTRTSSLWYSINDNGEFGMAVQSASCIETISHIGNKIVLVPDTNGKSTLIDLTTMRPLISNKVLACLSPFDENGIAKIKLDRIGTRFINTEGDIAASAEALTEAARRKSKKRTPVMTERKKSPGNLDFAAFLMN